LFPVLRRDRDGTARRGEVRVSPEELKPLPGADRQIAFSAAESFAQPEALEGIVQVQPDPARCADRTGVHADEGEVSLGELVRESATDVRLDGDEMAADANDGDVGDFSRTYMVDGDSPGRIGRALAC
jgi:hypothetical protein